MHSYKKIFFLTAMTLLIQLQLSLRLVNAEYNFQSGDKKLTSYQINNRLNELDNKISQQHQSISKLLKKYTEQHPDIRIHKIQLKDYQIERDYLITLQDRNKDKKQKYPENKIVIKKEKQEWLKIKKIKHYSHKEKISNINRNKTQKKQIFSLALNTDPNITNKFYTKGALKLPITIKETAGLGISHYPVFVIVPLPQSRYFKTNEFMLVDQQDNPIESQFEVVNKWWGNDNSLRHIKIYFNASVSAFTTRGTGIKTIYLKHSGEHKNNKLPPKKVIPTLFVR